MAQITLQWMTLPRQTDLFSSKKQWIKRKRHAKPHFLT